MDNKSAFNISQQYSYIVSIVVCTLIIFVFGILPVIIGTCLYKKGYKKIGVFIRITGYIFFIPVIAVGVGVACFIHEILF